MSINHNQQERSKVRRGDRAVDDKAWISALLHRAPLGYIATSYEGQPFINSNLFVYDQEAHAIYFHTARKGRTRQNIEQNDQVCFTVTEMGRLLPADVALEFSTEYASVVAFGRVTIVEDDVEATRALQMLLDKYFPHLKANQDYRAPVAEELKRTTTYRLTIEEISAKMKEVDAFPGSFTYEEIVEHATGTTYPPVQEYRQGDFIISTDRALLNTDTVHHFLAHHSYWARGITRDEVVRSLKHALCFGVYHQGEQIGLARVISDFGSYAHLSDVFIVPEYQGRGLGKWLIQCIMSHPQLQGLRKWTLETNDAQGLYEKFGFRVVENPEQQMEYRLDEYE